MGLGAKAFHYLHELLTVQGVTFPTDLRMLELGNMILEKRGLIVPFISKYGGKWDRVAKGYFEGLGFSHTSIDINGLNGSLSLDLRKPFPKELGKFDVLTDFGTIEHIIDNQYRVFKNFHDAAAPGALMVHTLPGTGYGHGYWSYPVSFFENLVTHCGYFILDLRVSWMKYNHPASHNSYKRTIFVGLIKGKDNEFMGISKWQNPVLDKLGHNKCCGNRYDTFIRNCLRGNR